MAERPALQLDADEVFERRWGMAQKLVVAMLAAVVLAGLAGLFGRGPLSSRTEPLPAIQGQFTYERLARNNTPGQIVFEWRRWTGASGEISFDRPLAEGLRVTSTSPVVTGGRATGDGPAWTFATSQAGRIVLSTQPSRAGPLHGHLTVFGQSAPVDLFVYP